QRLNRHHTSRISLHSASSGSFYAAHNKGRRSADRRNCPVPRRANRCRHLFALGAWARYGRARLPALRHGTCGGERTPPLSFSPHFLGPGVIRCYLHLTCPFSPAGCPAVPVVVPDGRICRSRPSAECKSARGNRTRPVFRCASRTRPFKWASYCFVTEVGTYVNVKVTPPSTRHSWVPRRIVVNFIQTHPRPKSHD